MAYEQDVIGIKKKLQQIIPEYVPDVTYDNDKLSSKNQEEPERGKLIAFGKKWFMLSFSISFDFLFTE